MKLSPRGRALIQEFEGLMLTAYRDGPGWSIGFGHYLGTGDFSGKTITRAEADRLFDDDVRKYEAAVSTLARAPLEHEFDAMTSLCYNVGTGGFANSTVLQQHNAGNKAAAADAFLLWNKSQGKVLPVLVRRREKERSVYLYGYSPGSAYGPSPAITPALPPSAETAPPVATTPPSAEPAPGWESLPSVRAPLAVATTTAAALFGWLLYRLLYR